MYIYGKLNDLMNMVIFTNKNVPIEGHIEEQNATGVVRISFYKIGCFFPR